MKNRLNIFSDYKLKKFLTSLLSDYELFFMELKSINHDLVTTQANMIVLNNNVSNKLIDFKNLKDNCLILYSQKNINIKKTNGLNLLSCPLTIIEIKNRIRIFIQNLKLQFHELCIENEKLINLKNNYFCYLTKVELDIVSQLIKENETNKNFIKENILNIRGDIETNSLESHLTRIRKKMAKIKTKVKIQTKNDKLIITL